MEFSVKLQRIFAFLAFVSILTGCKAENPNPEALDPIYADLVKLKASEDGKAEGEKKNIDKALNAQKWAEPRSIDLKNALRDERVAREKLAKFEQKSHYYDIRMRRREAEDKEAYHKAFKDGKEWPDKDEYSHYQANRRLAEAPRQWSQHLPRLFELPTDDKPKKKSPVEKEE